MTTITRATLGAFRASAAMLLAGVLVFSPFTYSVQAEEPATPEAGAPAEGGTDFQPEVITTFAPLSTDVEVSSGNTGDLQAALIDSGNVGKTIVVSGDYVGDLSIAQGVTVVASSTGASVQGQITITSSNVSVSGLTVTNPTGPAGIFVIGGAAPITSIHITDNNISNIGNAGFGTSAKGIFVGFTSSGNSTITDLVISNNEISNVQSTRGAYGILVNYQGDTTATISSNSITSLTGAWAHGIGLEGDTSNTVLSGNSISGLTGGSDAHAIFFEDNAQIATVTLNGHSLGSTNDVAVDAAWAGYGHNPVVSLEGDNYVFGVNAFATIQAAIDAAAPGATVTVGSGTYAAPSVTKAVTLVGTDTTINGMVTIQVPGVSISGFTITNPTGNFGILINGVSDTEVKENTIENVGTSAATGNSYGIYFQDSDMVDAYDVVMHHNTISNIGSSILFSNGGIGIGDSTGVSVISTVQIVANDISNVTSGKGAYGILLNHARGNIPANMGSTPDAEITGNTITALSGKWAHAIGLEGNTPNAVVTGNTIDTVTSVMNPSNDAAAVHFDDNASADSVTITDNSFDLTTIAYGIQSSIVGAAIHAASNFWVITPTDAQMRVAGSVIYSPWLGDDEGEEIVASVDTATTTSTTSDGGVELKLDVAAGTVITGDEDWDGDIEAALTAISVEPVVLDNIEVPGFESIVPTAAIQIGTSDNSLLLSNAARILLGGQQGKLVGWTLEADGDDFHPITTVCSADDQATVDAQLGEGEDCTINVGNDLVIWTKHFTTFVSYTATQTSSRGGGGGGRSGSSTRASVGSVAGASTGGQVLGASTFNFATNLSYGSMAAGVSELQQILITAGYLVIPAPTGWFGPLTKAAVMKYQAAKSIPSTGFVGPLTRASLNAGVSQ